MTEQIFKRPLPHEKLRVFRIALEVIDIVREANIRDAVDRDQAKRSSKSVARNIIEAAGRRSPADKARVYAIARGEACETIATLEIAMRAGDCERIHYERALELTHALYAILTVLSTQRP